MTDLKVWQVATGNALAKIESGYRFMSKVYELKTLEKIMEVAVEGSLSMALLVIHYILKISLEVELFQLTIKFLIIIQEIDRNFIRHVKFIFTVEND